MNEVKKFIYVVGWFINVIIVFICDKEGKFLFGNLGEIFGELLVCKVNEGVIVLMLIWDDKFNNNYFLIGVMNLYDEDMFLYFWYMKVYCLLCFCKF